MSGLSRSEQMGILAMIAVAALFSAMDATAKLMTERYDPLFVVWARYVGQAVGTVLVFAPRLRRVAHTRRLGLQTLRSVFLFAATVLFFTGYSLMPLAEATAIAQVAPLMIVALAALVLGEPVSRLRWAAAGIGFCGALIIAQPGSAALGWAAVFPLGGALAFAAFNITTRYLGTNDPPLTTFFYTGMVGALVASLAVPFVWTTPALADLLLLGLMALLGAAGQGMLIVALRFAAASTLAPFLYVQLIWAAALGLLVFGDWPALTTVLGAAVIVAAGLVAQSRVASGSRPG